MDIIIIETSINSAIIKIGNIKISVSKTQAKTHQCAETYHLTKMQCEKMIDEIKIQCE